MDHYLFIGSKEYRLTRDDKVYSNHDKIKKYDIFVEKTAKYHLAHGTAINIIDVTTENGIHLGVLLFDYQFVRRVDI